MPGLAAVKNAMKGDERYRVILQLTGPTKADRRFIQAVKTLVRRYGGKVRVQKARARRARRTRKGRK
jgi:hypothetical protein